jgi:hypothetical protein
LGVGAYLQYAGAQQCILTPNFPCQRFSQQFHATPSAVGTIAEIEELLLEVEDLASRSRLAQERKSNGRASKEAGSPETMIDCVCVSHEFTDHCHKDTLLEVHKNVPVLAIREAARLIAGWKHFRTVVTVDVFGSGGDTDWRGTCISPLPDWIGISRLLQRDDVLNYHSALMIAFNNQYHNEVKLANINGTTNGKRKRHDSVSPDEADESAEAIVYTPHGIMSSDLALISTASPPIRTLAFLHGLHNVRVGTVSGRTALQSNLGAHNGLKAQRILKAKYWIGTHDEVKRGGGLVSYFLQRDVITLKDALDLERKLKHTNMGTDDKALETILDSFDDTNWIDLGNGESRILV